MMNLSTPWKSNTSTRIKGMLLAALMIIGIVWSFLSIFSTHSAVAQNDEKCTSFLIVGDHQGVRDTQAGLENKLRDTLGVHDITSQVYNGRNTEEIARQLEGSRLNDKCVIIEAGTGDLKEKKNVMEERIKKAVDATSGARKVFWVTPVVDDARMGKDFRTKTYADVLNNNKGDNMDIVNIQQLSVDGKLFDKNGLNMTNEGYKKRIDLIVGKVKSHNKDAQKPSSSSSSSSSSPSTPPANNGGNTGGSPQGGGSTDSADRGTTDSSVKNPQPGDTHPPVDYDKSSPKAMADNIKNTKSKGYASDYIMVNRWDEIPFPSPQLSFTNLNSMKQSLFGQFAELSFAAAHMIFNILIMLINMVLGDGLATMAIKGANTVFTWFIGGGAGANNLARVTTIASALVTIAFIFSLFRALDVKTGQTPRQRVMGMVYAVGRTLGGILLILFVSFQSSKNKDGNFDSDVNDAMEIVNENGQSNTDLVQATSNKERTASNFSTWEPLSMGWILSLGYYLGSEVAGAVFNIGSALAIYPLETFSKAISGIGHHDENAACDRYMDAINMAYRSSEYASMTPAKTNAISTMDYFYYNVVLRQYKILWGGNTFQSTNSFCIHLENANQKAVGDVFMLARSAGLYKEVVGSGNLIQYKGMQTGSYTNGKHLFSNPEGNISQGLPSGNGLLVNSGGQWNYGKPEDKYDIGRRARNYLHGGLEANGDKNPGMYYFASCVWLPKSEGAVLHDSMKGAAAMGATGVGPEKGMPPKEVSVNVGQETIDTLNKSRTIATNSNRMGKKDTIGDTKKFFDEMKDLKPESEDQKKKIPSPQTRIMADSDCSNDFLVNLDDISDGALTGFNSQNQWAERWNYTPLPPKSLQDLLTGLVPGKDDVKSAWKNFTTDVKAGLKSKVTGKSKDQQKEDDKEQKKEDADTLNEISEDNPAIAPDAAFSALSSSVDGRNQAETFWKYTSGDAGNLTSVGVSVLIVLTSLIIGLGLIIPLLLIAILNIIFAIYLFLAGFIVTAHLVAFAFRGGK